MNILSKHWYSGTVLNEVFVFKSQTNGVLLCQLDVIKQWPSRLGNDTFITREICGTHSLGRFWLGIPSQKTGFPDYWTPAVNAKEEFFHSSACTTICSWTWIKSTTRERNAKSRQVCSAPMRIQWESRWRGPSPGNLPGWWATLSIPVVYWTSASRQRPALTEDWTAPGRFLCSLLQRQSKT